MRQRAWLASTGRARELWARAGLSLAAATGLVCVLALPPFVGTASAAGPVVTTGAAAQVTTTGALIKATVDPAGIDTLYEVIYGRTGGSLTSTTGYFGSGSGVSPVVASLAVDGLDPGTSYTYYVSGFADATQKAYNGIDKFFTTAALPTGPARVIVPPAVPPANGIFNDQCTTDIECLSDINGVRAAQENLGPLSLPFNWSALTPAERIFVFTDMERVSRAEAPMADLVSTYDASVKVGMLTDSDPSLGSVPGASQSVWAGGNPTTLGAMYGFLYYDGYKVGNVDCSAAGASGCWSHRAALLADPADNGGTSPTEMGVVVGTDNGGQPSYAATLVNPGTSTPAGAVVFSWAAEQQYLVQGPSGGAGRAARESGSSRIATAIAVSQQTFPKSGSAGSIVLARDDDYPDALAGVPFAVSKAAPILLTEPSRLDPATAAEISRVAPKGVDVYLLGGTGALSDSVARAVAALGDNPVRIAGTDRFATAVAIAGDLSNPATILLVDGANFPDALAAGAAAAKVGGAILLSNGSSMASETSAYLAANKSDTVEAIGGPAGAADPAAPSLVGTDRFATSALVADHYFANPGVVGLASGLQYPDALAGGPQLGALSGPLLLTNSTGLPASISSYLTSKASGIKSALVYGGTSAVSNSVISEINAAVG